MIGRLLTCMILCVRNVMVPYLTSRWCLHAVSYAMKQTWRSWYGYEEDEFLNNDDPDTDK
jgi:hypothetical protein